MYDMSELNALGLNYTYNTYSNGESEIAVVVFNKPYESNIIGFVMSDLFESMIPLVLVETNEDAVDFAALGCAEGGKHPRISFDKEYYADLQNLTDEIITIIFHELGHLNNGDLTNGNFNFEAYHTERTQVADANGVLPMELKADDFAVAFLGREVVAAGLAIIKKKTESYVGYENLEIAVRELEERIERLM